jgi:dTMP kinase
MEREAIEFHHRVRKGYLELSKKEPDRWQVIDASKALSAVQDELKQIISTAFGKRFDFSQL